MKSSSYCDGIRRRDVLKAGVLGAAGLNLGTYLRLQAADALAESKASNAIFVWLGGGPPHLDMFDMKPQAASEIRGEFSPQKTNVPGIQVCEHLPQLAKCADKYAILNGVSHNIAGHGLGTTFLSTGNRPIQSLDYPGYGAVVSKELPGEPELPHFVAIPKTPETPGYLGVRHAPLRTEETPRQGKPFSVRGISLADGMTVDALANRQQLLDRLDTRFREIEGKSALVDGLEQFDQQAFSVLRSSKAREAFDTSRERPEVSEAFGGHRFGQSCLLALRLIEAGVRFATVNFSGWDTHSGNFKKCRDSLLPAFDQGLAALLNTLDQRGLLESTAVLVTGEFGRTPKINPKAGRDHWPRAFSVLMAGGRVRAGQVLGASDAEGMGPRDKAITPEDIAASFYHNLGIDPHKEYHTNTGRPVMLVRQGKILRDLVG